MGFYIKWNENGQEHEKSYDSKAGLLYRRKAIIKKLGQKAIVEEGQTVSNGSEKKKLVSHSMDRKVDLLGPVDAKLSKCEGEIKGTIIHSNWNQKTKSYTSRLYGSYNQNIKRVIEPDGSISLEGSDIVKKIEKDTFYRVLTDGRKFDAFGWPVAA